MKGAVIRTDSLVLFRLWFDKQTCPVKWSTIITAVQLPPVNEPSIAENILEKYKLITQS